MANRSGVASSTEGVPDMPTGAQSLGRQARTVGVARPGSLTDPAGGAIRGAAEIGLTVGAYYFVDGLAAAMVVIVVGLNRLPAVIRAMSDLRDRRLVIDKLVEARDATAVNRAFDSFDYAYQRPVVDQKPLLCGAEPDEHMFTS